MTGDPIQFPRRSWTDDLAELNAQAVRTLAERHPEPEGCPQRGEWVRVVYRDMDMNERAAGPWHHVTGWHPTRGQLQLRCTTRNRMVGMALDDGRYNWRGYELLRLSSRPAEHACSRCTDYLARDAVEDEPEPVTLPLEDGDPALREAVAAVLTEVVYDATRRARMQLMGLLRPPKPSQRAKDLLRRSREHRPT